MATPEEQMLADLGIPLGEQLRAAVRDRGADLAHEIDLLVTDDMAPQVWRTWNGTHPGIADPATRASFRRFLPSAMVAGLSFERVRDVGARPAHFADGAETWIEPFERSAAARVACRINIELAPGRLETLTSAPRQPDESWSEMWDMMRDGLFYAIGIVYPMVSFGTDAALDENRIRIAWNDVGPPPQRLIRSDQIMVSTSASDLEKRLGWPGSPA